MEQKKIMVVEDDQDDIDIIKEAFNAVSSASFQLHIERDGHHAITALEKASAGDLPCLIVLDYNMPAMTGAEVLNIICLEERYKGIPKFILSTSAASHHIEECLKAGASKYFVKPPLFKMYLPIVEEMLQACSTSEVK